MPVEVRQKNPDGTFKQLYPKNIQELLNPRQKLAIASVAKQFGMSNTTAYRRLRALGLYPKPRRIILKEELERLYVQEERSLREVARLFSCDPELIRNRLRIFGIPIRTHTQAMGLAGIRKKLGTHEDVHPNWRGGRNSLPKPEGYWKAHRWIKYHYGKSDRCDLNSTHDSTVYDWANISGEYRRERSDWIRLCHSCHYWFDFPNITLEKQVWLSPDYKYAYLEGRRMRV